jgi:Nif-specific regulatory protein
MKDFLQLLYDVSRSFSGLMELERLVPLIVRKAKEALGADGGAVLLLDPEKQELFFPYTAEAGPEVDRRLSDVRLPVSRGIAGWVVQNGTSQLVDDVAHDERWYAGVDVQTGMVTRSLLTAPLLTQGGVIGCLQLRSARVAAFSQDDLAFLDALAQNVAIAIENARLYERVRGSERSLRDRVTILSREIVRHNGHADLVGASPSMERVFHLIEAASAAAVTVLILGETGTGKELVARAIHTGGPRQAEPFVAINCSALSDTLLEDELFGHRKGAFTGATEHREGLFSAAHGGTIFLDEVGEMSAAMQVKLLRVLETGEILPVGENTPRWVDVRVISATNRDLAARVESGEFRRDLYYRLNVFPIEVPPLRNRRADLPMLVAHLLRQTAAKLGRPAIDIDRAALEALAQYDWPGNIRELRNELERASVLTRPGVPITRAGLSARIKDGSSAPPPAAADAGIGPDADAPEALRDARGVFEARHIRWVLERHGGNVSQAARVLGISRSFLHQKMKEHGIRLPVGAPSP